MEPRLTIRPRPRRSSGSRAWVTACWGHELQRRGHGDPGIVDQPSQAALAHLAAHQLGGGGHRVWVGDVQQRRHDTLADLAAQRLRVLGAPHSGDDAEPVGRQPPDDGRADALGRPGDDHGRCGAGLLGAHMPILVRRHVDRLQPYRSMSALRQASASSPCGQDIRFQIWCLDPVARLVYDYLPEGT
jgi:hypothetical protein